MRGPLAVAAEPGIRTLPGSVFPAAGQVLKQHAQADSVSNRNYESHYTRFKYIFLQVNPPKRQQGIAGVLQIDLGAGAYRAMWGYGVGPPLAWDPSI